ncbi:type IV pilin protein [Agarivorans sp. 1_MG-2023]|uniref:type IV pilin protein n=1 Tax=Agarivorans sp. 1_MG-2023 TaxID=3062634 RepID=UPI0026E25AC1|nr:type IV pilin protein [Agarivorans sp. 1_MG-2023]MDO6763903.1 type IV pilin protein [Agarivorans sp. 1_MG-2023]
MKRSILGVTLIELMIAVAIVAILAAVGYPAYTSFVAESRRTEAMKELATLAVLQEQYYADNAEYSSTLAALGMAASGATSYNTENAYYSITLTTSSASSTFTVKATAQGSQSTADKDCRSFSMDDEGAKTALDAQGNVNADCW